MADLPNPGSTSPAQTARTKPIFSLADERAARLARIKAQIDAGEWGVPSETLAGDLLSAEEQGLLCDCEKGVRHLHMATLKAMDDAQHPGLAPMDYDDLYDCPNTQEGRELARNIRRAMDYRERREAYDADPPGYPASFAEQVKRDQFAERVARLLVAGISLALMGGSLGILIYQFFFR